MGPRSVRDFTPQALLGAGNEGAVFRCVPELAAARAAGVALVAVKLLFNQGVPTLGLHQYFLAEFELLQALPPHANVVTLLTFFHDTPSREMLALVPDKVEAMTEVDRNGRRRIRTAQLVVLESEPQSLKSFLAARHQALTPGLILRLCADIVRGVRFLWQQRVVHRDLKLDNILVSNGPEFKCKLCDFGMALRVDEKGRGLAGNGSDRAGGNTAHLAPDVLNACRDNKNSAVGLDYSGQPAWELGVLMFEIVTGEHPFGDYPLGHGTVPDLRLRYEPDRSKLERVHLPPPFCDLVTELLRGGAAGRPALDSVLHRLANLL